MHCQGFVMRSRLATATTLASFMVLSASCAAFKPPSSAASAAPVSAPAKTPTTSLYARLGGYAALAAVTDDLLAREVKDPVIAPFFKGLEVKDVQRIRQHLLDQLCAATGGPCFYPGKDMKPTHAEMEITENVWNTFTGHIAETLHAFKVPEREYNELVVIVGSLKKDIVNKP